jgi:hypothetical protein
MNGSMMLASGVWGAALTVVLGDSNILALEFLFLCFEIVSFRVAHVASELS